MGNTPKLRFEGFTDAWEQRKLYEYLDVSTEKNIEDVFTKQDVLSVSGDFGIVNQIEFQGRSFAGASVSNYGVVNTGDVVYTKSPLNLNPYGIIKTNKGKPGIVSTLYAVYHPKENVDPAFVQTYFEQHARMNNYMHPLVNKGAKNDMKVSSENALKGDVIFPSMDEQRQIVALFAKVDSILTLHQRKCDALTKAKTFYLQNLFPQEGEKEPRLRLEGFTDSWNPYTLGDLYTERNERGNETLQILTVSIHTGVSDGALEEDELGKSVRRSEDKTLYKHVYAGDLIFNMMRAWQGAIGVAKREGMISPAYISAIPDERIYPPFMNYLLRRKEIISQINNLSYGVTDFRKRLYWDSFIKVKCCLPSVEEQKSITDVFEQLDTLITRQEHRIKALKTMKKFMLQNMFAQEG